MKSSAATRNLIALLAAAWALHVPPSHAVERPGLQTEFELGYRAESHASDVLNWRRIFAEDPYRFQERLTPFEGLRAAKDFSLADRERDSVLHYPLSSTWNLTLGSGIRSTHPGLPQHMFGAQLQKLLPHGWVTSIGFRHNEYLLSRGDLRTFSIERYWGDFRGAYTLFSSKPDGDGSAPAHRFQLSYYYRATSSVGLAYTTGRDADHLGAPVGLRVADGRNWTLSGRHWFARDWAVTYDLLSYRLGELDRREGLRLGLRYRF